MTNNKNKKELDDLEAAPTNNRDFTPEIAKLTKKRVVSLLPAIAISTGLIVLLSAFLYIFFFKNINKEDFNDTKKTMVRPEISKREFSFKKAKPDEEDQRIDKTLVEPIVKSESLSPKPLFKKYKSIAMKSEATNSDSTISTADSTAKDNKSNKETQQETETAAIVAEQITIDPNFLIPEGTYIPCSLTTRFTSDVTGRITCAIAEDVYSANGLVKLIEKGTKAIGVYQGGNLKHGIGRMFVIWTKLVTPDYKRINLVDSQVVGQLGEAGIDGWIDSHFFKRFGGAILLSSVKDLVKMTQPQQRQKKDSNTSVNINTMDETKDAFVAIIEKMLENSINIPPTMYKNQGDIIGILVGRDIDFSKVYKLKISK